MRVMERNVMRLVAVEQLRAACGIKMKNWNKNKQGSKSIATQSVRYVSDFFKEQRAPCAEPDASGEPRMERKPSPTPPDGPHCNHTRYNNSGPV